MLSEKCGEITALSTCSNSQLSCLPQPPPLLPIASLPAVPNPYPLSSQPPPPYPLPLDASLDRKGFEGWSNAEGADALSLKVSPGLPRARCLVLLTLAELLDKRKTAADVLQQFVVAQQGFDLQGECDCTPGGEGKRERASSGSGASAA